MTRTRLFQFSRILVLAALFCGSWGLDLARGDEVYSSPNAADLRISVDLWLKQRGLTGTPAADAIASQWEFRAPPTGEELSAALMRTFYLLDDDVRKLVDECRQNASAPGFWKVRLPAEREAPQPLLTHNVKAFVARHLTVLTAYNEAADLYEAIDIQSLADPASALFHRAVCEHHLLRKEAGLATLEKLLKHTEKVPERYLKLAELMRQDLEKLDPRSLGEVARQMKDVERRLALNRADDGVRDVERKIVETLDELIKKLEDQQKQRQQQQQGSGGSPNGAPLNPADDIYQGGVSGPGETDQRDLGHKDNWGDLPPKAKEAAKNMLEQEFPAHYRQAVEEYLKKLAERPAP